jgi:hypothetical protein
MNSDADQPPQEKTERQRAEPKREKNRSREPGSTVEVQQALDDALAESFPASDPVSIVTSQHEEAWDHQRTKE